VSTTVSTIADSVHRAHSTTTSSTDWVQAGQDRDWSGMEHAKQLMDQLTEMATVVEEAMGSNETTTLSAVYQYPVVPDNHGPDMLHVSLLTGSVQLAVWAILLVVIVLLIGECNIKKMFSKIFRDKVQDIVVECIIVCSKLPKFSGKRKSIFRVLSDFHSP